MAPSIPRVEKETAGTRAAALRLIARRGLIARSIEFIDLTVKILLLILISLRPLVPHSFLLQSIHFFIEPPRPLLHHPITPPTTTIVAMAHGTTAPPIPAIL